MLEACCPKAVSGRVAASHATMAMKSRRLISPSPSRKRTRNQNSTGAASDIWDVRAHAAAWNAASPGPLTGNSEDQPMPQIGRRLWAIAEGYIPSQSTSQDRAFVSHETACILNAGERDAHVEITLYFKDRDPAGPYRVTVPARRTLHLRFNDLEDPEPVPRDTDYASVMESDEPIVVQHTRLDSRKAELALLSTIAFPA
jgi:hypothetical protein